MADGTNRICEESKIGQVFIINASGLKDLGDRRCCVCHRQVDIGDVIVRALNQQGTRGTRTYHSECFSKIKHRKKFGYVVDPHG